jgi:hypothetical protein
MSGKKEIRAVYLILRGATTQPHVKRTSQSSGYLFFAETGGNQSLQLLHQQKRIFPLGGDF